MKAAYPHLMSPMKLGGQVLKSHLIVLPSKPPFLQGGEPYPTDAVISHYISKARHGVAMLTLFGTKVSLKVAHGVEWDFHDDQCQHHISMLTDAIHGFGAKCTMTLGPDIPKGWDVSDGVPSFWVAGDGSRPEYGREMPEEMMMRVAEEAVELALRIREVGFDGVYIHNSYRVNLGRFLSPITNKRSDEYGGSFENRIRYPLYFMRRIKEACGKNFIIETTVTADEHEAGGWMMEDTVKYAKALEGCADLLHIRPHSVDMASCLGFHPGRFPWLPLAEEVKAKAGTGVKIVALGGLHDLVADDRLIAEGRVDVIGTARALIADPDFGKKALEGRNEDVVPCIRCNKCHKSPMTDPWVSVCSVNPKWGLEHRLGEIVTAPERALKVAVVGGGPAGMNTAVICARRGHDVTLFEKSDHLGGLLVQAGTPSFKWPIRDFRDYLIRQVAKSGIDVRLNTAATPGMIEKGDYDVVIACIGSSPAVLPIPGANGAHVVTAADVFGCEDALGKKVAVIGGGEIGVETGMHLAELGRDVTVLEMLPLLAKDTAPIHYRSVFEEAWRALPGFHAVVNARCSQITPDAVYYADENGAEHVVAADSVVLSVGMKPKTGEAVSFFGSAPRFYMLGDCESAGSIQKLMRRTFVTANQI